MIHYYRCIGSDGWRHLGGPRCDNRPARQDPLDQIVLKEVHTWMQLSKPGMVRCVAALLMA